MNYQTSQVKIYEKMENTNLRVFFIWDEYAFWSVLTLHCENIVRILLFELYYCGIKYDILNVSYRTADKNETEII